MEESGTYQLIEERGERKALIRLLLRLGRKTFGEPDGATLAIVKGLTVIDRLDALIDRLFEATSWHELLA